MLKFFVLRIEVTNCIIRTILARIFTWEAEAVRGSTLNRDGVVDKVDIAARPLLVVLDELVVEVASRKIVCAVLVVT